MTGVADAMHTWVGRDSIVSLFTFICSGLTFSFSPCFCFLHQTFHYTNFQAYCKTESNLQWTDTCLPPSFYYYFTMFISNSHICPSTKPYVFFSTFQSKLQVIASLAASAYTALTIYNTFFHTQFSTHSWPTSIQDTIQKGKIPKYNFTKLLQSIAFLVFSCSLSLCSYLNW